jgi:polyhydroxyalkanoate synthase
MADLVEAIGAALGTPPRRDGVTAKDTVHVDGSARLLRFRATGTAAPRQGRPVLLVPSLINRWYVLDLRPGASVVESLVGAGIDTWCLDWGVPRDEDRHLGWDEVLARLARAMRRVAREAGGGPIGVLGYCMGGTLAGIATALAPERVSALVNLAGPFDFAEGGILAEMTDSRWFDADAVADAGNVSPEQMQSAFVLLRPTAQMAKWLVLAERAGDPAAQSAFLDLEGWASDNVPFPAAAYRTYVRELYQDNRLVAGTHAVAGRRVNLGDIRCPVLTVVADRDVICPPAAATALNDHCGAAVRRVLEIPGGHVGAVIGPRARALLYPALASFFAA